jgi:hypothetical protein
VGSAEYLVRLDDACSTQDRRKWDSVEAILRRHGVRPIVAIVPANADAALIRGPTDAEFWQRAHAWKDSGWMIAMHGYSHSLRPSRGGLVPVSSRSEFVGLPEGEQKRRIREGIQLLEDHGIIPQAWAAPAHGLDRSTVEALRTESNIRTISDSFVRRPVRRLGFVWIPQQLWHPRVMGSGLWTICLHPNEMDPTGIESLDTFISGHRRFFPDPVDAASRAVPYGLVDMLFETAFLALLRIRKALKGKRDGGT